MFDKNRKDFEKVIAYIAERAAAMAQSDLDPSLAPDLEDVKPYVREVLGKIEPHVTALLQYGEEVRIEGEGIHPSNLFPDALKRACRRRVNAV
jgi:hypothetical protein